MRHSEISLRGCVKPKYLSLFFLLAMLESLILLFGLAGIHSTEEHTIIVGLSGPRVAIAALLLSSAGVFGSFWLLSLLNPSWTLHLSQSLDTHLSQPDSLLVTSFYIVVGVLAVPALALLGGLMRYGLVIKRLLELLVWVEGLAFMLLVLLGLSYREIYCRPGFFVDAPRRIIRASFISCLSFWLALGLMAMTVLVLFPSSTISMERIPGHDSGIFLYFGQQILRGQIPFRDLWDHKPPMIFYMDALGLLLGNGSMWGVWILEYLALAGSSLMGFFILRRYYGKVPAALAVCLSLGYIVFLLEGGNLTEEFSLPLQWGVLLLFAISGSRGWDGRGGAFRAFAAGVLFSLALNFKQTMVGIWAALFLWLGLCWLFHRRRSLWKVFAWAGLGAALTLATILLYFAAYHTLGEYWRIAYVYNMIYSEITPGQRFNAFSDLVNFLTHTSLLFPLVALAWAAGAFIALRATFHRKSLPAFPLLVALIDLPIEIVLISISGKNFRHYFMTLIPVMTILSAWGISQLAHLARRFPRWQTGAAALLLVGLILTPSFSALVALIQPANERGYTDTVRLIQNLTQPRDYVLMWGSQTVVTYLSGRAAPSRFVHQKPLFQAGYANRALSDEMLNDLKTHTPQMIINTHLTATPFITTGPNGECQLPPALPDGMDAVFNFICQNYTLTQTITNDQWEVYQLHK
jgi:hypothetical protein